MVASRVNYVKTESDTAKSWWNYKRRLADDARVQQKSMKALAMWLKGSWCSGVVSGLSLWGGTIRLTADLSAETLQARKELQDIFKVIKGKNLQPRSLYTAEISFRFDREIKTFTDTKKLREFSTNKQAFQQMLKELL